MFRLNENFYEVDHQRASAWANIKDSHRKQSVLTAIAIGIETIQAGKVSEFALKLNYNGIYGFLPMSFIDNYEFKGLQNFVGKTFEFVVSYVDLESQTFAANRIKALDILKRRFWRNAKAGEVYPAFVRGVDKFNIYLLVHGVPTKMHRNEFSYTFFDDLREEIFIGETIEVKILEINKPQNSDEKADQEKADEELTGASEEQADSTEGSILVSSKALETDPMIYITEYQEKATYLGEIYKVHIDHGIFIRLEPRGIQVRTGFPPGTSMERLKVGEKVNFKIQEINAQERRIRGIVITPRQNGRKQNHRSLNYVR